MRLYTAIWGLTLFILLVGIGCESDPTGPPPIVLPDSGEAVLYSKHIEPIFLTSCAGSGCHIGDDNEAGLSLDSWDNLTAGSDFGGVVVPYNGVRSHLFQHINTDQSLGPTVSQFRMPLSRDPLPIEQIKVIKEWIDQGAKNDNGEVPLAGEDRPRLFVTCQSEDLVCAVDLQTEYVARYIGVGSRPDEASPPEAPHNIAISPDKRFFYVNLIASSVVEKYDARTFENLGQAEVGLAPAQIRVTADGSTLYVSNFDGTFIQQFITRVDAATMTSQQNIEVEGLAPHGVTLSQDERFLYTMNAGSDDVSKIDLSTDQVVARIPIVPGSPPAPANAAQHEPYQSEITSNGLLFVTCRKSGEVRVIDLAEDRVIDSITVGAKPLIPALSPDGTELWVPNQGSNTVSIIDVASRQVVRTIDEFLSQPHAVIFTKDGKRVFVSCENQAGRENLHHPLEGTEVVPGIVYVVEVSTRTLTRSIEVAGFAAGMIVREEPYR
ncbi:MAG: beta-propeller fold lactonase family protein [Chlorobi bacterium]|nr:beta-propeller fold lactonase family protein [Chlorobiota bacterium]